MESFKGLQSSGAMKGIAAGANAFNNSRSDQPVGGPGTDPTTSLPADDDEMKRLMENLARYFPQNNQPQQKPIKIGY